MWNTLHIQAENVVKTSYGKIRIKMPKLSKYRGFRFGHPDKLLIELEDGSVDLTYSYEFVFHLYKLRKGKYNKFEIIERMDISAQEMEECFTKLKHIPEKLEPEKAFVPEELLDE